MRAPLSDDRGYATVASAGIIAAVASLLLVIGAVVNQVINTHRVQVAADLSAIAAATARYEGFDACATARRTAELNDARLTSCEEQGRDVVVSVASASATHTSRAGPL